MPKLVRSDKRQFLRALSLPVLFVVCLAIGLTIFADRFLHNALTMTIINDAQQRAEVWAQQVSAEHPELKEIDGERSLPQEVLSEILENGNDEGIFRFKYFSPNGRLLVVSDEPQFISEEIELGVGERVRTVFETGTSVTVLHDGTERHDRPDAYAESYIQAATDDGDPFGVIEVYVDVTEFVSAFHNVFHMISRVLIIGSALAYLIPSLFFIVRREKMRMQDKKIMHLSRVDPLTGVLNRRAFSEHCGEIFAGEETKNIGVVFLDIDRFKQVNDGLGHDFGDALLLHVARTLEVHLHDDDVLCRYGGDEFILLSRKTTKEDLLWKCDAIRNSLCQHFTHNGSTITIGVSIGAHVTGLGEPEEMAIRCADLALHKAKTNGRGQVVLFSPKLAHDQQRRRHVENTMRAALAKQDGFYMEYQPIFSARRFQPDGFEALLRLNDDQGIPISPAEFIPIAEECGLMLEIGTLALHTAIESASSWPDDQFLAVNLSVVQFENGDLVEMVKLALKAFNFPASRLHLEITESLLIENEIQVGWQLEALQELGVAISLDDFGAGYSGLGYLLKFQFDILKIDRMFLVNFDQASAKQRQLVSTVINLGHNLGLDVVVEGIETEAQYDLLKLLNCDHFQGFLLGRPMSATAITDNYAQAAIA